MTGQSNMMGYGRVSDPKIKGTLEHITQVERKYQHLLDANGKFSRRQDVRNVYKNTIGNDKQSWLGVGGSAAVGGNFIGPELQVGHILGAMLEEPVLILKVGTGNRALGWDFLPPGSEPTHFNGLTFAGHGECPASFPVNSTAGQESSQCRCRLGSRGCAEVFWSTPDTCRRCWCKEDGTCPGAFYAGYQYEKDLISAKSVLDNLGDYFPGYQQQGFEIGGYFFWQGHRDTLSGGHANAYYTNLVQYITTMRRDFASYEGGSSAPFVQGSIGFGGCGKTDANTQKVWQAQMDTDSASGVAGLPRVSTIDARSFWRSSNESPRFEIPHYHQNANTYLEIGTKLGWQMVDFLKGTNYMEEPKCPS